MKNLTVVFLFVALLATLALAIPQDPTPAQIDSLVKLTMMANPWPEMAIPPGSIIHIPTPDGYTTCYIWEWDNGMGMPACYWQACEAELRFQFCLARIDSALAADTAGQNPPPPPPAPSHFPWWLPLFLPLGALFFRKVRRTLIPWAGPQIIPGGLPNNVPAGEKGNIVVKALKKAGASAQNFLGRKVILYSDFIKRCANGMVGNKLGGSYEVYSMKPVEVALFGSALYELERMGIKILRVETGYAKGVGKISDPQGGRTSLIPPGTAIFRVYYMPGKQEEGTVPEIDLTVADPYEGIRSQSPATTQQLSPLPQPPTEDDSVTSSQPEVPPPPTTPETPQDDRPSQPLKQQAEDSLPWPKNGNDIY